MPSYISSNENRLYAAVEAQYGQVAEAATGNRFPAVRLAAKQQLEKAERKDKTGGRTFPGVPSGLRKLTSFELQTYMTGWTTPGQEPGYGPLFQAALGGAPQYLAEVAVAAGSSTTTLLFGAA